MGRASLMLLISLLLLSACAGSRGAPVATLPDGSPVYGRAFTPTDEDGYVLLECTVQTDGSLTGCRMLEERPAGQGFGDAALQSTAEARLDPTAPNFSAGSKVRFSLRFRAED